MVLGGFGLALGLADAAEGTCSEALGAGSIEGALLALAEATSTTTVWLGLALLVGSLAPTPCRAGLGVEGLVAEAE